MSSETALSASIRESLARLGVWCIRVQSGKVRVRRGMMHLAEPGTPDLLLVGPRELAGSWLEVKTTTDLRPDQIAWHERAARQGVRVAVVRSVEQAVRAVRDWQRGGVSR